MPSLTKIKGLSTFHSEIQREAGSLTVADNIVLNADNTAEPRRGMTNFGDSLPLEEDRVKQLLTYRDRILRHYNGSLQFDSDGNGTFVNFSGTYNEIESGIRIKSAQSNGNLYFTTTDGIKKISALNNTQFTSNADYITSAGGPKALDVIGSIVPTIGGFLIEDSVAAYRIVWGLRDVNDNVILGEPSGRLLISNPTGSSDSDVSLTFSVPEEVTTSDYFYQVYRTGVTLGSNESPGDDMNLVFEENYDNITNPSTITLIEQQPESFRVSGTLLYTNPNSGGGISSSNAKPPIAKDIAVFKNSTFYANTSTTQNKQVTLLGLSDFVSGETKFNIANSQNIREYKFVGSNGTSNIRCGNQSETTENGYIQIYSANDEKNYVLWMNKGTGSNPLILGSIGIEIDISEYTDINISTTAINVSTDTFNYVNHGYVDGTKGQFLPVGILSGGLLEHTDYYVIKVDNDNFKVAKSQIDVLSNNSVDILSQGTVTTVFKTSTANTIAEKIKSTVDNNVSFASDFTTEIDNDLITFSLNNNGTSTNTLITNLTSPWSINSPEITPVRLDLPVNTTPGGYISLYTLNDIDQYVIWFTVDLVGTAPVVPGALLIQVNLSSTDTLSDVWAKTKSACTLDIINSQFTSDFLIPKKFFVDGSISGIEFETITNGIVNNLTTTNGLGGEWSVGLRTTYITVADKTTTNDSSYISIHSPNNEKEYIIWYDKTGTAIPPTVSGDQIKIDISIVPNNLVIGLGSVNFGSNKIVIGSPLYETGMYCYLTLNNPPSNLPTGLSENTPYWIIDNGDNTISLASSYDNAIAETEIVFPADGDDSIKIHTEEARGITNQTLLTLNNNVSFSSDFDIEDISPDEITGELKIKTKIAGKCSTSIDSDDFTGTIENNEQVNITQGSLSEQGTGENYNTTTGGDVLLSSISSVAGSIDETSRSLIRAINQDTNGICYAYYQSGPDDLPGIIRLEARELIDEAFYVSVTGTNINTKFSPTLPESVTSDLCIIPTPTNTINFTTSHKFNVNDFIYAYGQSESPYGTDSTPSLLGTYYVVNSNPGKTTMQLSSTKGGSPIEFSVGSCLLDGTYFKANVFSSKEENPNYLYYSKTDQPESVPLVNFLSIGSKSSPIERIVPLRDALYVIKSDSIYQVTGNSPDDFGSFLYDNTLGIIAPDTAAVLNNQLFFLSDSGITQVSDTGAQTISRDIEDKILGVTKSGFNYRTVGFALGYETDRAYLIYLPTEKDDTTATQSFRYNPFNNSWTRWMLRNNTCGLITSDSGETISNHLILGSGSRSFIEIERKNFDRSDYTDEQYVIIIASEAVSETNNTIKVPTSNNIEVGDTFVQSQYLSLSRFNRILKMLDIDPYLDDSDYFSLLEIKTGDNLENKLNELITKVDLDDTIGTYSLPTIPYAVTPPSQPSIKMKQIGDNYNIFVNELNLSDGIFFTTYQLIDMSYSLDYEAIITNVDIPTNTITVGFSVPFFVGKLTHHKGYTCDIEFAPQTFGDPGILKHTPESSFVFDSNNFYSAIASFKSDISGAFTEVPFRGKGPGFWGGAVWDNGVWGDLGNDNPLRILVPRDKSRNRYLICKFKHKNARETFKLLGISIKMKATSTRAYRDTSE